jgi:hypothetical protein
LQILKFFRYLVYIISKVYTLTEVLPVRAKKSLKDEAEKKLKAQKVAKELSSLMDIKAEEWVKDVKATRHEM